MSTNRMQRSDKFTNYIAGRLARTTLARDNEGRARMGEATREKMIGEYSWERIGTQLEGVFHDIMREKV